MSTTTTDPTALTIDGAAATLAALPDSPDVRTAAAMLAAAPTAPTDPRPTTTVMNDQGVTFHARLIRTGDRYGLADKLTNDGAAMVEFFDAEADPAKFGPLGQFVSRYYVDTFNETAEDGRGIALEGSVPRWTITAANVAEVAAWLASLDSPAPLGAIVAPDKLNAVMEFDHVVTVNEDGTVSDGPAGVYAPDLLDHEVSDPTRWAPFGNYTSQQGGGWLMHNCESIGGQMARDILAEPGTYVAVVAYWSPDENDDHADEEGAIPEGWAVFRIEPAPTAEPVRYIYVETTNEEGRHNESIGPFPTAEDATAFLPLALADPSWSIIDAEVRADYEAPLVAHWVHEWPAWIAERSNEWGGDAPEWSLALLAWQDEHPDMWAKVEAAVAP